MHTLTFQTRLDSDIIKLFNIENFIGKDVIISIIELPQIVPTKKKREWNYLGAAKLNKEMDKINIRDFAHE